MKKLLLVLCTICSISAVQAAPGDTLELTLSNIKTYTSYVGTDFLRNVNLSTSTLPNFNATGTLHWDLRGDIKYDTTYYPRRKRLSALTPAQYADSTGVTLGNIYFYGGNLSNLTVNYGLYSNGMNIDSQFVLANRTTIGTDTLIFDYQTDYYHVAGGTGFSYYYQFGLFPISYYPSSSHATTHNWHSDYTYATNFRLYDIILGHRNVPGAILVHKTQTDTIVAQSKMSMVMPFGDTAKNIPVLQCKKITTETDSFTLNGSPFSASLLSALGVTQGMSSNTYSYCFYRTGRLSTPLMQVWYTDNTFSTVSKVWIDTTYIATITPPSAIPTITSGNDDIKIYPNPVTGRIVNIDIANTTNGAWYCELINISGQQVAMGNLSSEHTTIAIPSALNPGIYYLRISNDGRPVTVKALNIQ